MKKSNIVALVVTGAMLTGSVFTYAYAYKNYMEAKDALEKAENVTVEPLIIEVEVTPEPTPVTTPTPTPTPTPKSIEVEEILELENKVSENLFGNCRITAYCACEKCCGQWANNRPNGIVYGASGEELISGVSVACSLPFGTKLKIDGFDQTFIVHDRTSNWVQEKYGGMTVDIYIDSHEGCYEFMEGMSDWANVYIMEENV